VDVFTVRQAAADMLERVRSTSEPAVLTLRADRLCAHVGPVSKIETLSPQAILDESGNAATRDPIAHCVGAILGTQPALRADCLEILTAVPTRVAAEFRRADAAFEGRNASAGLVAPPPPKSHTV
jgi:TPP-dependent pyruvate/acetoin dehydrogenase alpha subunit